MDACAFAGEPEPARGLVEPDGHTEAWLASEQAEAVARIDGRISAAGDAEAGVREFADPCRIELDV